MNRRGFLKGMAGILASGFAPAVVGSGVLMPVRTILMPPPTSAKAAWGIIEQMEWAQAEVNRVCGIQQSMMMGKSVFQAQQAVRLARAGHRIAVISGRQEHMRTLIEEAAKPLDVPDVIVYVPWRS